MKSPKNILPNDFFAKVRKIISIDEALKDVTPVNWKDALKDRKDNENQVIILKSK